MKIIVLAVVSVLAGGALAWHTVPEMEQDFHVALTNVDYLLGAAFSNRLSAATNWVSSEANCERYILLAIHSSQNYERTVDERWLTLEAEYATRAIAAIGSQTNKWQYWMSRFIRAGAYAAQSDYGNSFSLMTNSLAEVHLSGFTNEVMTLERALLDKFEMPDLGIYEAMKVMAGMSAAVIGNGNAATNYAYQLPMSYRNVILRFMK